MSGRRRTPKEQYLKDNLLGCFHCFPFCGGRGKAPNGYENWRDSFPGEPAFSWRAKDEIVLPPAGNGHPPSDGPCPECNGTGIPAIPLCELGVTK